MEFQVQLICMNCQAIWYCSPASVNEMIINLTAVASEFLDKEQPCQCENPDVGIRVQLLNLPTAAQLDQIIGEAFAVESSTALPELAPRAAVAAEPEGNIPRDYAGYQWRGETTRPAAGEQPRKLQ